MKIGNIYLDHIGIATNSLDLGGHFWNLIGLNQSENDEANDEQGVNIRFFSTDGNSGNPIAPRIELLEPQSSDSPIGRFLEKRGPGVQQICFRVDDIIAMIEYLIANGVRMIDDTPKKGADGCKIAFVHPSSTGGVLVELSQHESSI
ncbi:MAG: methylmalonyl-CoA epimerase [archaeon]|nr:methylmalonyl-CoA epimerase [archaeon]MDA0842553.1 methylmalonyl-CoA epimerase [archaeon]